MVNALLQLARLVAQNSDPRSQHLAATLLQLSEIPAPELSAAQLGAAFEALALRKSLDPAQLARNKTCKELAQLCSRLDEPLGPHGYPQALEFASRVWGCWVDHFCVMSDPRSIAMTATLRREQATLRNESKALNASA